MKTQTAPQKLADAVWNAGNRHGADSERKAEILRICTEALDMRAYGKHLKTIEDAINKTIYSTEDCLKDLEHGLDACRQMRKEMGHDED